MRIVSNTGCCTNDKTHAWHRDTVSYSGSTDTAFQNSLPTLKYIHTDKVVNSYNEVHTYSIQSISLIMTLLTAPTRLLHGYHNYVTTV